MVGAHSGRIAPHGCAPGSCWLHRRRGGAGRPAPHRLTPLTGRNPGSAATTLDAGPPVVEDLAVDQLVVSRKGPRLKGPDDASHSPP